MYHINVENERRPNFIVRGLYLLFEFLSDFGPMLSALFSFLGRSSLVIVNLIILAGTIVLSAAHSLELLRLAGATGGLEWVGMCVWELIFIFSSIMLANDFRRGNLRSGWATWSGFLMGFAFVEVSNVMGMADNWIGRAIGISTPILLLISKGLLAHQFKTRNKKQPNHQPTTSQNDRVNQPKFDPSATKNLVEKPTTKLVEKLVEQLPENQQEEQPKSTTDETNQPTIELVENQPQVFHSNPHVSTEIANEPPIEETKEPTSLESEEPTQKMIEQPTKEVVETNQENNHQTNQNTIQDTNQNSEGTTTKISDQNNQPADEEPTTELTKKTTKRKKQLTRKRTSSPTEKMKKEARKWALDYYQENGKLPGRLKVEKGVGCSQNIARDTINELKEELGIKAS